MLSSGLELGALVFVVDFLGIFAEAIALIFNSFLGNGIHEDARDVLEDDVIHYSFYRSCFDVVVLAFWRTLLVQVFINVRASAAETTRCALITQLITAVLFAGATAGIVTAKFLLFDFDRALTWLEYMMLIHSLVIAALELIFVLVIVRREFSWLSRAMPFAALVNETQNLDASMSRSTLGSMMQDGDGELTDDEVQDSKRTPAQTKQIARRIVQLWKEDTCKLLLAVVFLLCGSISSLFLPKYTGIIVSQVLNRENPHANMMVLLVFIVVCAVSVALRGYMMTVIGEDFELRMRCVVPLCLSLRLSVMHKQTTTDRVCMRPSSDKTSAFLTAAKLGTSRRD